MSLKKDCKFKNNTNMLFMGYPEEEISELYQDLRCSETDLSKPDVVIGFRKDLIDAIESFIKDCPETWIKKDVAVKVYRAFLYYLIITKLYAKNILLGPSYPDYFQYFYGIISAKEYDMFAALDSWSNYFGLKNELSYININPQINIFVYDNENINLQMAINDFLSCRSYNVSLYSTEDSLCTYYCTTGHVLQITHDYGESVTDECALRRRKAIDEFMEKREQQEEINTSRYKILLSEYGPNIRNNKLLFYQPGEEVPQRTIITPSFEESDIVTDYYGLKELMAKSDLNILPVSSAILKNYESYDNIKDLFEYLIVRTNKTKFLYLADKTLTVAFDLFKRRSLALQKSKSPIEGNIFTHNFDQKRRLVEASFDEFIKHLINLMRKNRRNRFLPIQTKYSLGNYDGMLSFEKDLHNTVQEDQERITDILAMYFDFKEFGEKEYEKVGKSLLYSPNKTRNIIKRGL